MRKKLVVSLQRNKCIGCNFCAERAPEYFRMSRKDGKSNLLKSVQKKDFYTLKIDHQDSLLTLKQAMQGCPVKIIRLDNKILNT